MKLKVASQDVDAFVETLPVTQQTMVKALRATVRAAAPQLQERVYGGVPVFTGRSNVAALLTYDEEVHLAFFEGAHLTVSNGMLERTGVKEARYLLQGVGDRLRFLRLRNEGDLEPQTVTELVREAVAIDQGRPAPDNAAQIP